MRDTLESRGKDSVKREVVSASANLEVISQESFVKRLEDMSSACYNCHRERTRSQRNKPGRKGKSGRRKQLTKSKMPIVIHLKDTLRYAGKQWQTSLDGDSDVSARSTDEEQYSSSSSSSSGWRVGSRPPAVSKSLDHQPSFYRDVGSIPEFVPRYSHHFHQNWPYKRHASSAPTTSHKSPHQFFLSTTQKTKEKSHKNLTELISVIEKAHMKDPKDIEPNLSRNSTDGKLSSVLNNVSATSQNDSETKRKNMAECRNVELICNDLSTSADKLAESTDDSDSSDKASVVSSTDTTSDDVSDHPASNAARGPEFASSEFEHLAEYTIGAPLVRYSCQSSQCSECFNCLYAYQYSHYVDSDTYCPSYLYSSHQLQRPTSHAEHRHKAAPHHRASVSSDSDAASDVEDSSTTSSSSSSSTTSKATASVLVSIGSISPSTAPRPPRKSRNPHSDAFDGNHKIRGIEDKHPVKRATASWKGCQLWDIGVSQPSRRASARGCRFSDSVYVDLTGLDISISVIYHTEPTSPTLTWPYPVHSFYQAAYSPSFAPRTPGISHPVKFNNRWLYPFISDQVPANELKKCKSLCGF